MIEDFLPKISYFWADIKNRRVKHFFKIFSVSFKENVKILSDIRKIEIFTLNHFFTKRYNLGGKETFTKILFLLKLNF